VTARSTSIVTVPAFGRRHQAARPEDSAELPDLAHHVRRGDRHVEVDPAALDLLDVVGADEVGPGLLRLARLVALGDHEDPDGTPGSGREHDGAPDDLVGVARVDSEPHGDSTVSSNFA
jgi:hypothetical protein